MSPNVQQAADVQIYEPVPDYIPRVAAVHDICGYGKCSLAVVIPVLAAAGVDVCPVPTAVFSNHTGYESYTFLDTSEQLTEFLAAWQANHVEIDGIYSGFLGSESQIQTILDLSAMYPGALMFIDPVMGDHGVRYKTYTDAMCDEMKRLAQAADVLTPNLTEAAILTGIPYEGQSPGPETTERLLEALLELGSRHVVLKGIQRGETVTNLIAGREIETVGITGMLHPLRLHGTGDLFSSVLIAALMAGRNLEAATRFATDLLYRAMLVSEKQPRHLERGVNFEFLIGDVAGFTARGEAVT